MLDQLTLNGENPEGGAHIALSPDGKHLYASLRVSSAAKAGECKKRDGVAIYKCLANGKLKPVCYQSTGGHPRHFALSADGKAMVVACRDDDTIEIYPLNKGVPKGEVEKVAVSQPTYVGLR